MYKRIDNKSIFDSRSGQGMLHSVCGFNAVQWKKVFDTEHDTAPLEFIQQVEIQLFKRNA
jgi:hypothetical protein